MATFQGAKIPLSKTTISTGKLGEGAQTQVSTTLTALDMAAGSGPSPDASALGGPRQSTSKLLTPLVMLKSSLAKYQG